MPLEQDKHEHKWVHLRKSEIYETGYRRWSYDDIFFCEKCLEEKKISKEVEERKNYNY